MQTKATYFDGKTSNVTPVIVYFNDDGSISITSDTVTESYSLNQLKISSRLGNTPRTVAFPDGSSCHIEDNDIVDDHLRRHRHGYWSALVHTLESRMIYVIAAVFITVTFSWAMITHAIPAAAKTIAFQLPDEVNQQLGKGTLETLDRIAFEPSTLDLTEQQQLSARFQSMLKTIPGSKNYQLHFRSSKKIGANAFALPSGIIVVTDDLVAISQNDDEIVAILAHEIGHLHNRHGLRMSMQSSAVAVLIAVITGDPFSSSSLLVALPTLLLNSNYSRQFETEADDFAYDYMLHNDIELTQFANILERISESSGSSEIDNYLSTHPPTEFRLQRFR